jgi:hypothetical protein
MWSGSIIVPHDGHDFVNVVFQSRHLNRIIIRLENMWSFYKIAPKG